MRATLSIVWTVAVLVAVAATTPAWGEKAAVVWWDGKEVTVDVDGSYLRAHPEQAGLQGALADTREVAGAALTKANEAKATADEALAAAPPIAPPIAAPRVTPQPTPPSGGTESGG